MTRSVRDLPKAHLHLHFTGSMRVETVRDLAATHGIRLPDALVKDWPPRLAKATDERGWFRFQRLYDAARACVRSEADMRRIVREAAADDVAEGSRWLELQVDPTSYAPFVGGITPALEIVLDEARKVTAEGEIGVAVVVAASRMRHPLEARTLARLAAHHAGDDAGAVVGFGLSNDERRGLVADFAPAFAIARRAGLALVPHGGELLGAQSVMETLEHLEPDRIGHGVRSVEDPQVLDAVAEAGVTLEVCPGSNVALGVYADPATCRCVASSTQASTWLSGRTTRCSSARASSRSTPRPATSVSTTQSSRGSLAALSREAGCRTPGDRLRSPTWTRGSPLRRDAERPARSGRIRTRRAAAQGSGRSPRPIEFAQDRCARSCWREDEDFCPCPRTPIDRLPRPAATSRRRRSRRPRRRARGVQRGEHRDRGPHRTDRHHPGLDQHVGPDVHVDHVDRVDRAGPSGSAVDRAVSTAITATMKDPDLGHTITVNRIVRRLSWPAGQPVGAKQFEIVGVLVTFTAGSRYSASISPSMLSLVAASPAQTVSPTSEFAKRWGATPLKAASRSQRTGGWVFFKVDRGTTNALSLAFNRPPYTVSTTGKKLPQKTFSVTLTK